MIAAAVIWWADSHYTGPEHAHIRKRFHLADPICTVLFSILVLFTTINILKHGFKVLLNSTPEHIKFDGITQELMDLEGVNDVHDLHIWSISSKTVALSVHVLTCTPSKTLADVQRVCKVHGINHTTIQVERMGTSDLKNCEIVNVACGLRPQTPSAGAYMSPALEE